MNPEPPSPAKLQAQCDRWNKTHNVGVCVRVRKDNGDLFVTVTKSEAYVLSGHSAVIHVEGISGCYSLDRVRYEFEQPPPPIAEQFKEQMSKVAAIAFSCQFCEIETLASRWVDNNCPNCGRKYDAVLAQEGDD